MCFHDPPHENELLASVSWNYKFFKAKFWGRRSLKILTLSMWSNVEKFTWSWKNQQTTIYSSRSKVLPPLTEQTSQAFLTRISVRTRGSELLGLHINQFAFQVQTATRSLSLPTGACSRGGTAITANSAMRRAWRRSRPNSSKVRCPNGWVGKFLFREPSKRQRPCTSDPPVPASQFISGWLSRKAAVLFVMTRRESSCDFLARPSHKPWVPLFRFERSELPNAWLMNQCQKSNGAHDMQATFVRTVVDVAALYSTERIFSPRQTSVFQWKAVFRIFVYCQMQSSAVKISFPVPAFRRHTASVNGMWKFKSFLKRYSFTVSFLDASYLKILLWNWFSIVCLLIAKLAQYAFS